MLSGLSAALLLMSPPAVAQAAQSCPGFDGGRASQIDADNFYLRRALDIVRAATADDSVTLNRVVSSDARFEIWRGDASSSATDRGPLGAKEMVRDLGPVRYQAQSVMTGPISIIPTQCTWDVTVLFTTQVPGRGISVRFSFSDGLLVSAVGQEVTLLEGSVR